MGHTGKVIEDIRRFSGDILGNLEISDSRMQSDWSDLMEELARVLELDVRLLNVRDICGKIKDSGAPEYAKSLQRPIETTVDNLLPNNWREAWRLRRLATYLDSIDAHFELKGLAKGRIQLENDLSRAYEDVVVKRTWLRLLENASPSVRQALTAFLTAIRRIGRGSPENSAGIGSDRAFCQARVLGVGPRRGQVHLLLPRTCQAPRRLSRLVHAADDVHASRTGVRPSRRL